MMVNGSSMVDTTVGEAKKVLERAVRDHRVGCLLSICTSVLYYQIKCITIWAKLCSCHNPASTCSRYFNQVMNSKPAFD